MDSRTMVKLTCLQDCVLFRTISRKGKSPQPLYVFRSFFDNLPEKIPVPVYDGLSWAEFRRNSKRGTISICFFWRNQKSRNLLSGHKEHVVISNQRLVSFLEASAQPDGPREENLLSVAPKRLKPRFVFRDTERLRDCLLQKSVRRKLIRFLRDNFDWQDTEEIHFYSNSIPYSFTFQAFCTGEQGLCGNLTLHNQEDMSQAYYSIHT